MTKAMVLKEKGTVDGLEMRDYPAPSAGPGAIVADVGLCGVCGTDTHIVMGMLPVPLPHVIGHEWFGRVRELGEGADMDALGNPLKKGDPIATSIGVNGKDWYSRNLPDRQNVSQRFEEVGISSAHTADEPPHLWGAFAEQVYLPEYFPIFKFPPGLDEKDMVMVEPVAVTTRAFKRAQGSRAGFTDIGVGTDPSQNVVVMGMGPMGMCQTAVCNLFGINNIIGVDSKADRLEVARRLGAAETIDTSEVEEQESRLQQVQELTGGVGADIVFEAAGFPFALEESLKMVRKGGAVVELGNAADVGSANVHPFLDICQKDVDILGSFGYSSMEYKTAMATLVKAKRMGIDFGKIVGDVQPLDSLPQQIIRQGNGEVPGRIVVRP